MDEEWDFIICEKEMTLFEKEKFYKLIFNIKNKDKENVYDSIVEIINNNDLFELLFELNKDVIDNFKSRDIDANSQYVSIKIINNTREIFNYPYFTIHINYASKIEKDKVIIYSVPFTTNNLLENEIYLNDFNIEICQEKDNVSFLINYSFDEKIFDTNLVKTSLSAYILKMFYRVKMYFE